MMKNKRILKILICLIMTIMFGLSAESVYAEETEVEKTEQEIRRESYYISQDSASDYEAEKAAQEWVWGMINKYADPEAHLEDLSRWTMTDEQFLELKGVAEDVTKNCTTDYEKIRAILGYVADRTYYDYYMEIPYYEPYNVYTQKRAACMGYARLIRTLLNAIEIPCMNLHGENHEYNAAYDSQNKRWIFVDATMCSKNSYYTDGKWYYYGYDECGFDLAPSKIAFLAYHEVYGVSGLLYDNVYYSYDLDNWPEIPDTVAITGVVPGTTKIKLVEAPFEKIMKTIEYFVDIEDSVTEIDLSETKVERLGRFGGGESVERIKFPSTLLEADSFDGFSSLKEVDLSHTKIQTIAQSAFSDSDLLEKIEFPSTITTIEERAFWGCSSLKEIDLSHTKLETIEEWAFLSCYGLEKIQFPSTLKSIGEFAFHYCSSLKEIDLSDTKVENIDERAFEYCDEIEKFIFSPVLKSIGEYAFFCCESLKEIELPSGLRIIEKGGFNHCNELVEIYLPDTIEKIGEWAFSADGGRITYVRTDLPIDKTGYGVDGTIWRGRNVIFNPYSVVFNGNGASSGSMESMRCQKDTKYNLTLNTYKRKGYKFNGWNTKKDGSGKAYSNEATFKNLTKKKNGKVTLYAQWKPVTYTITYELNKGKNSSKNPVKYKVTSKTITLSKPTRKGYTFKGWYTDSKYKNKITQIKKGSTGNKKLYAKWEANKYKIVFKGNGSTSGSMKSMTSCKYGKTYTLSKNKYTRKGYKFVGWNTKKDGSGKMYTNKDKIKNLTSTNGKTVTLYAIWKKK